MNNLERSYGSEILSVRMMAGEVASYYFDAFKLRIAEGTFYTPDYVVILADGTVEFHETKGHWEEDARVKIKVAASIYPEFKFIAVTRVKKVWTYEIIGSGREQD